MCATLVKILLLICITCFILVLGCFFGFTQGKVAVQAQWDAHRVKQQEAITIAQVALTKKLAEQETAHAEKQEQIAHELETLRTVCTADLALQHATFVQRLLQSTRRSQVYRDQAEASVASCRDLASHAAKLDRTLEEGRSLVGELQEALGLRNRQLILLGEQLLADRRLMQGEEVSK